MHYFNRMGTGGLDEAGVAVAELYRRFRDYLKKTYSITPSPLSYIESIKREENVKKIFTSRAEQEYISLSELPPMGNLSKDMQEEIIHTLESNKEVYTLITNLTLRHYLERNNGMYTMDNKSSDKKPIIPNILKQFYLQEANFHEETIKKFKIQIEKKQDVSKELDLLKKAILAYKPLLEKTKSKHTYKLSALVFASYIEYCRFYSLYVEGRTINLEDLNKNKEILLELLPLIPKSNLFYVWLDQNEYFNKILYTNYEEIESTKEEVRKFIRENIPEYNEYLVKKMLGK